MQLYTDNKDFNVIFTEDDDKAESKYEIDLTKVITKYNILIKQFLKNDSTNSKLYSTSNLEKYCSGMQKYYLNNEEDLVMNSLAFNFALNTQQILPPSMRGLEKINKYKDLNKAEASYSLDLQVIDLHWLFTARQKTNQQRAEKIKNLEFVKDKQFYIDDAYSFAQNPWSLNKKAEALLMDELEEVLSHRIMGTKIANRKRQFFREKANHERLLLNYCTQPQSRLKQEKISNYLTFLEALKIAGGNDRTAAEVHSYLTRQGKLDKEQISSYSKTINNRKSVLKGAGLKI